MINPGLIKYEVVLDNQYYLRELLEGISLDESLSEIAYHAQARIVVIPDLPEIKPGQEIRLSGVPFDGSAMVYLLHPGVVWECNSTNSGQKHLTISIYDKTIYLAKSEDEYLLPAGQTASQRLRRYAADWGISLGSITETKIPLEKAIYRAQPIYNMIQHDLKETAEKGGDLFKPRMTPNGLELVKLGSNKTVWVLESNQNIKEISQNRTLEGTITQVKVLGNAAEDQRSPVLAIEKGEIASYGTLQKVIQNERITSASQAKSAGQKLLTGVQETFNVECIDINTIRAGDKVVLNKLELITTSVKHELGSPGKMVLELSWPDLIRRRYYLGSV